MSTSASAIQCVGDGWRYQQARATTSTSYTFCTLRDEPLEESRHEPHVRLTSR